MSEAAPILELHGPPKQFPTRSRGRWPRSRYTRAWPRSRACRRPCARSRTSIRDRAGRDRRPGRRIRVRQVDARPRAAAAHRADRGRIVFEGRDVTRLASRELRPLRRRMQMIFQDPYASLESADVDRRRSIAEPLEIHGSARRGESVARASTRCSRRSACAPTSPRAIRTSSPAASASASASRARSRSSPRSSLRRAGQRARRVDPGADRQPAAGSAERNRPGLSVRRARSGVVRHICDRVAVMYLGRIVELATDATRCSRAETSLHAGAALGGADARSRATRKRVVLQGDVPSPLAPPPGCPFHPRCPVKDKPAACFSELPKLRVLANGSQAACHVAS